jgi:PAS domain S-box-containing protein
MSQQLKANTMADEKTLPPALLARLVNASPAVLYSCKVSEDCGTIAVTDNVRAMLGYVPEDFVNDPSFWALRIHPEDSARVFEEMPRLFREGAQTIEYRFRRADGNYVWLRDHMQIECDDDGNPLRILGCWLDVTRQKPGAAFAGLFLSSSPMTTTTMTGGRSYAKQT